MSVNQGSYSLQSPGTLGLNTQDEDNIQDHRYATLATNCIISKNGNIEARKGTKKTNATAATGTPTLDVVFSYLQDDGEEFIISTGGNKLWHGITTLTDITGALTITGDDWQFQNYKGEVFGYQAGHAPIFWDGTAASFALLSSKGSASGLVNSKCHLSAFGRSWVVDTTSPSTIVYSDLLIPEAFTGGSSGSLDLNTVWTHSNDVITALAVHNNNLVIFCQRSIVIFSGADDITSFYLIDVINSNGCIARDSIQTIGNDIFYLANDGVRALSRTVIQDNMPFSDISNNIREDVIASITKAISLGNLSKIRSTYNEQEGFYVLNLPSDITYVCDVRKAQEGIFRWTTWDAGIYGLSTSNSTTDELYFGLAGGFLASYKEYYDTNTTTGAVNKAYIIKFKSSWIDIGLNNAKAVWKKAVWYVASIETWQLTTTWAYDFEDEENTNTKILTGNPETIYGTGVYGTSFYGSGYTKQRVSVNLNKTGSLIRLGFQSNVTGNQFSFNRVELFMKQGQRR